VTALPECLTDAPAATRERVALRCLQEVASVAAGGDAAATAGVLRAKASRSCEDLLLELIGEVRVPLFMQPDLGCDLPILVPFSICAASIGFCSFELVEHVNS
jgi:hypothetical protein